MSNYLNIPYIKTTNLAKIVDFFPEATIMELKAERRVMRAKGAVELEEFNPPEYVNTWNTEIRGFYLNFNRITHGQINKDEVKYTLDKVVDGLAVVTYLAQIIEPDDVIKEWLGPNLNHSYQATGKTEVVTIWKPTMIGKNSPERKDTGFIENIQELNKEELQKKGFKLSVLDCVELKTYYQWKKKAQSGNPHEYDTGDLSSSIRKYVDADNEWKSNRQYTATEELGWRLSSW